MGMYTELIFGAELNEDTPESVIKSLKYMIGELEVRPDDFPLPKGRCEWLFRGSSYYFGVNEPVSKMWKDRISECWVLSTRSNIKNYENEIETFLKWIKPYIKSASGSHGMYAIVTYEADKDPALYYLE